MSRRHDPNAPRPPFDDGYPQDIPDDDDGYVHPPDHVDEDDQDFWEDDDEFDPDGGGDIACPHCSKIISEDHKLCPHCGFFVTREDESANTSSRSPFLKGMIVLILVATILGILLSWK
jgi:hypothetical protein